MRKNDLEDFERRINLIFHGAIALTLLPFVFLYLEFTHDGLTAMYPNYRVMELVIALGAAVMIFIAFRNYRRHLGDMLIEDTLEAKFNQAYDIYLGFYLRLFIAGLVLVFTYWLTNAGVMVVAYVVLLFLLSLHRPTRERFSRDLPLTKAERDFILKKSDREE